LNDARGPACNAAGEVFFISNNQIQRIDLDGKVSVFAADAAQSSSLTVGADGTLFSVSSKTGNVLRYDANGQSGIVYGDMPGNYILAHPNGGFYVTSNHDRQGSVWFLKEGKTTQVDSGLKRAAGVAFRPDQWLLSVADGDSKWTYSYQIAGDGTLTNRERFFWHHVADWDDDAGAESVCYSLEGRMFVATRMGIQITADDGPTQVILPMPDGSRVIGVCLGGKDKDTLFAICREKLWKRKVQHHAMGAFTPWIKVGGTKL
jgi:sugar lactone lactonase YvrE